MTETEGQGRSGAGRADPNDWYNEQFLRAIEKLVDKGLDQTEATIEALDVMHRAAERAADRHISGIVDAGREYVSDAASYRAGFEERLRAHWGEALDLYEVFVAAIEHAGGRFITRNSASNRDEGDDDRERVLAQVLAQLNGQSIRIAREVHVLLRSGFPLGALALSRSLHEISVRAMVLSEFGKEDEHADLAERFVLHDHVANYQDALIYQRDAGKLGYEPFTDEEVEAMKARHDELIDKYGKAYKSQFGWASGLPDLAGEPTFERMETAASLGHHRGLYKWSSHVVHGDSKAMRLARIERGGRVVVLTNATNDKLADPGQHALLSLYRTYVAMATSVLPMSFYDDQMCQSLQRLLDRICHLLVDAEKAVGAAEQSMQAELAKRGLRFDPVLGEVPLLQDSDTD
ncbi:hypothetical protein DJ010_17770 [Nocardioides silvaticus]|uniref:Uncharacterized protein n=1 Tax=Nocardioides silvaticus TaxID=2201891 RepID=A0A316TAI0_9ACTN|nr:DUF5677 domain-containing protein [Nocardioides silvaticus]PWN01410.1 hypothetical protein DJ010_17770 [Nocardioides silvaticus]